MSKIAHYLQEHVVGEVMTAADLRQYFSNDGSILSVAPALVMYPHNESDVRKTARFVWQLAERGRSVPITARGFGTNQTGAAIGSGIVMVFLSHMRHIVELDAKAGTVIVEPGVTYGKLQQTLHTHDRYLPPYPASFEYSSIGGAIANNASGEKSLKYGDTRRYVAGLRVVLANGEVIETGRLSKRELNRKLGLATFEGEIYRSLDKLFEETPDLPRQDPLGVSKNAAGYDIWDIKRKDGSFDLTPLFVGAQGTLGIITQATLRTEVYSPQTTLLAAHFDDLQTATQAIVELRNMSDSPSAMEMVDRNLLKFVQQHNPNRLKGLVQDPLPAVVLLVEFDDANERVQKRAVKKAQKILHKYEVPCQVEREADGQEKLWALRRTATTVIAHADGNVKALPFIEDGIVPVDRLQEYISGIYSLFDKHGLPVAVWGHAGDANLHVQPFLDLAQVGDRQKVFKLADEYYQLVRELGGSISAEHGDGRLRGPYLQALYGDDIYALFQQVKQIFDPYNILNPGVKVGVGVDDIKPLLRHEYGLKHLYDHLPYS